MKVSINQPAYLPWLGYYNRIAQSDLHIVLDHVQFEKNSFTNRNKIRTAQGSAWLTLPLKTRGKFGDLAINSIELADDARWRKKHWDSMRFNYARAPHFEDYADWLQAAYAKDWTTLNAVLKSFNAYFLSCLNIDTRLVCSSDLNVTTNKAQLVLDLCKEVGATTYLSGPLGRDYLDAADFEKAGIALEYHDYEHPRYHQFQGGDFLPYMSIVDLLFNEAANGERIVKAWSGKTK